MEESIFENAIFLLKANWSKLFPLRRILSNEILKKRLD